MSRYLMNPQELKAHYDRDGFLVVPQFLPDEDFAELKRELDHYIQTVVPTLPDSDAFYVDKSRPETLKQLQHMGGDPFFREYANHPRWKELAELLLGEEANSRGAEWFNKPAGTNAPTPAHQDNYYFNFDPPNVLTMWLALEDVDEENGCLRYVRGSHRQGRRPHASSQVLGFSQGITDFGPEDEANEVCMSLKANDLLIHHGWTVHRAEPNRSTTRHRPSFAIVFQGVSCQIDDEGRQRYEAEMRAQHEALGLKN
ncbi:MAG: phytanoyl-CoA dioxygenase family protein [Planctomycetaceae bacterium]|nr:phytanoyl-CoA dioxygenase family protein [Planctomycetaceae bacterium]